MRNWGVIVLVAPLIVGMPSMVFAETTGTDQTAHDFSGKASARQLADFKSNPDALLKANPIGGLQLSGEVKALTLADPDVVVDDLLNQLKTANSAQVAAIGSGLGQAVKAIEGVDKALADELAKKIAGSGSAEMLAAYNLGTSDIQTFSTAGGPGGGVGGGLGGAIGGVISNTGGTTRTSAPGNFNTSTTASTSSLSAGASVSCTKSVSPRRTC